MTPLNKKPIEVKKFTGKGTFEALRSAQEFAELKGYEYGSLSSPYPLALMKGSYDDYNLPEKWKNFTNAQRNKVHGVIFGNFREGPITVYIYE